MTPEQLLQTLRDGGMDDEAIKGLLSETLAALEPGDQEAAEKAKASELLGVTL